MSLAKLLWVVMADTYEMIIRSKKTLGLPPCIHRTNQARRCHIDFETGGTSMHPYIKGEFLCMKEKLNNPKRPVQVLDLFSGIEEQYSRHTLDSSG